MVSKKEKIESLKIIIDQQHRDADYLLHIYNRMRAGQNILLAASFAVLAYLYSAPSGSDGMSLDERFFFPHEDYGRVIYFIAAGFFLYGIIKLMVNVFGAHPWITAYQRLKKSYTYDELDTLEHYKRRNDACIKVNGKLYFKRKNELTFHFYSVTISAIILVVMKTLS